MSRDIKCAFAPVQVAERNEILDWWIEHGFFEKNADCLGV